VQREGQRLRLATGSSFVVENTRDGQDFKNKGATSMSVGLLDHFNIRTRKLADTVRFYEDVLDLKKGNRPNFTFPGAWMYSEGKPVVHLVDISQTDEPQKPDSGVVHHVAFASSGFNGMKQRLKSKGLPFDTREVPGGDLWQIFVTDPNGVMIELNYETAKEQG
jgi:catechol 2,3-dioxygenase-like lactoylglutathione lyase family enzyme